MRPRKSRRAKKRELVRSIKKLNARFRKLRTRKQRLLEQLWAACFHTQVYETKGSDGGPFSIPGGPSRICLGCGFEEKPTPVKKQYRKLRHSDILEVLEHNRYVERSGWISKYIGIDL